jgi:thioredoxin reductase (NADPH)
MMTDLIIIGAGPSGLSCAIEGKRAGLTTVVLDKGGIADAIRRFPTDLVWFSTPEMLEIGDVPFLISTVRPTRVDTLNYYARVVRQCGLDVRTHDAVSDIRKTADGGFEVFTAGGLVERAASVVIATGYFDHPAHLGVPGEGLPHVFHHYDEPYRYAGCDVVVVGGRNSAVEAALDLYRHSARVTLVHRGPALSQGVKYWILPDIENRIKAGQIAALFESTVEQFQPGSVVVRMPGGQRLIPGSFCFVLIGYGPDASFLHKVGIELDVETLSPVYDPATYETNVPGLFVAGSVVAGKDTNRVFVENGRLHGRPIIDAIMRYRRRIP